LLILEYQRGGAEDDREKIVEVVGDAARQPAHRFHSLRLPQLLVARPKLGLGGALLERRPAALDELLGDGDLVGGPVARRRVVHGDHGATDPLLGQGAADEGPDPQFVIGADVLGRPQFDIDVAHDHGRTAAPQLIGDARSKVGQTMLADDGSAPLGVIVQHRAAIAIGVDLGVGAARGAQVPAQQRQRDGQDALGVGQLASRVA
jgi:hypothetical protein